MVRWAGAVVGMAALALGVAYLAFGWPVLVIGGPLFVGTVTTLVVLLVTERPRRVLADRRNGRTAQTPWQTAADRGDRTSTGLMSGFFEISPQVQVPPFGEYRIPAQGEPAVGGAVDGPGDVRRPWSSRSARPAGV